MSITEGVWVVERDVANPVTRIVELQREASSLGRKVYTLSLPGGRVAYRGLLGSEKPFARHPSADGITDADLVPPKAGREEVYPWDEWMDGKWHLAIADRDFRCTTLGFTSGLRRKATGTGLRMSATVIPGGPLNIYSDDAAAVVFIFLPAGQDADVQECAMQLVQHRKDGRNPYEEL